MTATPTPQTNTRTERQTDKPVTVTRHVTCASGVLIFPPGAAKSLRFINDAELDAHLLESDRHGESRESRAHHTHVKLGAGHPGLPVAHVVRVNDPHHHQVVNRADYKSITVGQNGGFPIVSQEKNGPTPSDGACSWGPFLFHVNVYSFVSTDLASFGTIK